MAKDPELEARVERLKQEVKRAREDAAAARILAGGVDRDVDDIRREFRQYRDHNTQLHNATRADLADVRHDLADVRSVLANVRSDIAGLQSGGASLHARMGNLENHVDNLRLELRSKFDMVAAGQQQIVDLINQKFD